MPQTRFSLQNVNSSEENQLNNQKFHEKMNKEQNNFMLCSQCYHFF